MSSVKKSVLSAVAVLVAVTAIFNLPSVGQAAPSKKKVSQVIYEDGTTEAAAPANHNSSEVRNFKPAYHDPNRVVRRILPTVGLTIGDTTIKTSGMRVALGVGVLADLIGKENLVLETGLLYRQMGTSNDGGTLALNYITVPVSAKYYLKGQASDGFYFKGGFTPGINVASSAYDSQNNSTNISSDTNTFDFGFLLGVGGKYRFTESVSGFLEADYNRGLANVSSKYNFSVNTLAFAIMSGVAIEL